MKQVSVVLFLLLSASGLRAQLTVDGPLSLHDHVYLLADFRDDQGAAAGANDGQKSRGFTTLPAYRYATTVSVRAALSPSAAVAGAPGSFGPPNVFDAPGFSSSPTPFDFTRTAPHLAFFCRLEINKKAGNVIPAKFRLGGHSHWQDQLMRR